MMMSAPLSHPHILLVKSDAARDLPSLLEADGLHVSLAASISAARQSLATQRFDAVAIDAQALDEEGEKLCRRLRERSTVPLVIWRSDARPATPARMPHRELVSQIRAVLRPRRTAVAMPEARLPTERQLSFGSYSLDTVSRALRRRDGSLVVLTTAEFDLLSALVHHAERILSREQLVELTRFHSSTLLDRSVDILISRLRKKIEVDPREPVYIKTVRAGGYLFAGPVESAVPAETMRNMA